MHPLLILIDGNSLINRAFYALPPLTTGDGRPSQAVYGFTTMLLRAITDLKPTHAAVAFDLPAPTFRHKLSQEYKATRKGMPDELASQMPMLKTLLTDMGIKILQKEGFEADDILGEMSTKPAKTIIITGDRDAFQLIDDRVSVAFTRRGISQLDIYDPARFVQEFGFSPSAIVDYKALCGDSSDNIAGVPGVGDKTATALIAEFGSLNGVYQNLDKHSAKLSEKLKNGQESALLSYRLATIERQVGLGVELDECRLVFPFSTAVKDRFREYNFRSLVAKSELFMPQESGGFIDRTEAENTPPSPLKIEKSDKQSKASLPPLPSIVYEEITDLEKLKLEGEFSLHIAQNAVFSGFNSHQISIPLSGDLLGGTFLDDVFTALKPFLEDEKICKIVLDAKALKKQLAPFNISLNNFFDLKLSQYLLDVAHRFDSAEDVCDLYGFDHKDAAAALVYAAKIQRQQLEQSGLEKLYFDTEIPLVDVLFDMEQTGFKLDMTLNSKLLQEFSQKAAELSEKVQKQCQTDFNLNSPKQLAEVLFGKLGIPYPKKSKTFSTAFEILDPLKEDYPVIADVLEYRRITKLCGTYLEGFRRQADGDGVVHTDFKQALTLTGRLSSVEPNLQNIPVREEDGRRLRGLFVAREGRTLVCADYSQIELRLLAHFSQDPTMTAAFRAGEDIHAQTAALVYGVRLSDVTGEMRQAAKAVNFGIIYGISDFGLAKNLRIPPYLAKQLIENYFAKFASIKQYLDECVLVAKQSGQAVTLLGRVRRIAELSSSNHMLRKFGERVAMNMPLQGSAADIIKLAMVKVAQRLKGSNSRLILQVHDELIIETDDNELDKVKAMIVEEMENVYQLRVPLRVSVGVGKNWLESK